MSDRIEVVTACPECGAYEHQDSSLDELHEFYAPMRRVIEPGIVVRRDEQLEADLAWLLADREETPTKNRAYIIQGWPIITARKVLDFLAGSSQPPQVGEETG